MSNPEKEAKKEADALNKERIERCVPLARAVVKIVAESDPHIGEMTPEEKFEKYKKLAEDVIEVLQLADAKYVEVNFIFQLAAQALDSTKELVMESIMRSFSKAEEKLLGKEYRELTLQDLDGILKS